MNDDGFMNRLEAMRRDYHAPPETPRDEIWDAIESALEQAPPEEILTSMRDAYQSPTEAPRDEMWSAIEAALPGASGESSDVISIGEARQSRETRRPVWRRQWTALATAAAALLVLGIGLGRVSMGPTEAPLEVAATDPARTADGSFRAVAVEHFARTESLLTMVSSDARAGRMDVEVGQWGRTLLLQTRLLIDSPAAQDQVIRELLEDLEIILIQVARLSPGRFDEGVQRDELDLINEGLDDNDMMLRIRSVLPIGSVQAGI